MIRTGVAVKLPPGTYGRIAPRSGLAYNNDICVAAGVIDRDYYPREIGVLLYKVSSHEYKIKKGDRIAQLIVTNCVCQDTGEAERDGGFGSTGM